MFATLRKHWKGRLKKPTTQKMLKKYKFTTLSITLTKKSLLDFFKVFVQAREALGQETIVRVLNNILETYRMYVCILVYFQHE